ncbi:uncharacterized protein [Aegilops tauschii subsp. strangulata]|uniref:uncharacterized protein n=1 Tax=Aegilops tauschii subsp. strangulata TaxID=200361 RepID=UPI003CC8A66E
MSFPVPPPLTLTNYTSWAIKVEAILNAQGLWGVVASAKGAAIDASKSMTAHAMLLGALSQEVLMQVVTKPTAKEVWDSLKVRFVGVDRVKAARLATLRGEFDRIRMLNADELDVYAGKVSSMAARYAVLGATLNDAAMVKKLLHIMTDRLYATVAGIEKFCDVEEMPFD